jgi:hypothetical protein
MGNLELCELQLLTVETLPTLFTACLVMVVVVNRDKLPAGSQAEHEGIEL